jgi:hypothetical protein
MVIAKDTAGLYSTHGIVTPWLDDYFTISPDYRGTHGPKMASNIFTSITGTSNAYDAPDNTRRGFAAVPAGYIRTGSVGYALGAVFHTASKNTGTNAFARRIGVKTDDAGVSRSGTGQGSDLQSVRCKRD